MSFGNDLRMRLGLNNDCVSILDQEKQVDNFSSENTWVPECVLLLKWLQKDKSPVPLEYKVKLDGTGEERYFFRIVCDPG